MWGRDKNNGEKSNCYISEARPCSVLKLISKRLLQDCFALKTPNIFFISLASTVKKNPLN